MCSKCYCCFVVGAESKYTLDKENNAQQHCHTNFCAFCFDGVTGRLAGYYTSYFTALSITEDGEAKQHGRHVQGLAGYRGTFNEISKQLASSDMSHIGTR